jgi:hypothetical protein
MTALSGDDVAQEQPQDDAHQTPSDVRQTDVHQTDVRESNPSAAGPRGLEGDLGISSERTGPLGSNPPEDGIEGTSSHGSAARATDGVMDSTPAGDPGEVPREHPDEPAEGGDPDVDQPDQERTSTEDPAEGASDVDRTLSTGVDRTVGEPSPDPVANKHEFDPSRNPRH